MLRVELGIFKPLWLDVQTLNLMFLFGGFPVAPVPLRTNICNLCNWIIIIYRPITEDILLGKVFSQTLFSELSTCFGYMGLAPYVRNILRGLGRGISDLRSLARIPNGYPRGITE